VAINTVVELEVAHYLIKNLGSEGKRKTGIGGRDATILASMEELEIDTLMTPIGLSKG
jgi:hypothetical protein